MSVRRAVQVGVAAGALAIGGLVAVPAPAQAVPPNFIIVGPGCSLDDAIFSAQHDQSLSGCADGDSSRSDAIELPPGTYPGPFTIPYSSGGAVYLIGQQGEESTTILDGAGSGTTLTVAQGAVVHLDNLTITGGIGAAGADAGTNDPGGAGGAGGIANAGDLHLVHVAVTGNTGGAGGTGGHGGAGNDGGRGGSGGPGGIRNTGRLTFDIDPSGVNLSLNTGGIGGEGGGGGHAVCLVHHSSGPYTDDFPFCPEGSGNGGQGGRGGAGNLENTGAGRLLLRTPGAISAGVAGDGGVGGDGGGGDSATAGGSTDCAGAGNGGSGGNGGPGGLFVGDGTAVSGDPAMVSGNSGGAGAAGGAGGSFGCGPGTAGDAGSAGESDIHRGTQTLSWTTEPPDSQGPGTTFTPAAESTSGLTPVTSVEDDCSLDSGTGEVTLAATVGGSCTVDADEAGNGFFLAATQLSKTVSITDATPPVITPNIVGTLGSHGWYTSDVTLTWTVTDPDSAVTSSTGCDEVDITADQASTDYTCEATSSGGTDHNTVSIKRDATAPALTPSVSPNPVALGGSATASANATDSGSGVDTLTVQCGPVTTSAVGSFTVSCSASDLAGNASGAVPGSYTVLAGFGSFISPLPRSTYGKSGSTIPVKFTLSSANVALGASTWPSLGAHGQVRAILTQAAAGTGPVLASATCSWDATHGNFICNLRTPKIKAVTNPYFITVQERGSTSSSPWFAAPSVGGAVGSAVNPVQIGFK